MLKQLQKKVIIFFIFFQLLSFNSYSQLTFNTALTPAQLVQNILIQGGLSISNITFSGKAGGATTQIASFTNASSTYLGLTSGVVMATGYVPNIAAAGNANGNMKDQINTSANDADLASLAGIALNKTFDAAILEFDFVPTGNTIAFTYVFGSEEEPKWVCSQYDDVFGFFLSGPNPAGGNYTKQNLALIPGTNYPVSVNTVNSGSIGTSTSGNNCPSYGLNYSTYYVDNLNDPNIVFGGLTKVLTATATVIPCKTYHIKLAICDTGNGQFDSGVFLGANSFTSPDVVNVQQSYSNTTFGNNAIKGCSNGLFTFATTAPVSSPMTVNYVIGGTAINGVDYSLISDSVIIQTGQDTATVSIQPLLNGTTGTVILGAIRACDTVYDTIKIVPYDPMNPITSGTATLCQGASTTIGVTNSGGIPSYTYNWSNSLGTSTSYNVTPNQTTIYTVTATDACGQSESNDVTVTVNNNVTLLVNPSAPTICPGDTVTLNVTGAGNYTWSPNTALSTTTGPTVIANPTTTTTYTVTGSLNGCSGTGQVVVTTANNLAVNVTPTNPTICPGDTVSLTASGGATSYTWSPATNLSANTGATVIANPTNSTTYTVVGTKGGCSGSATVNVVANNNLPLTVSPSTSICLGGNGTILTATSAATSYTWSPATGLSATIGFSVTANPTATTTYTVTGTKGGCSNSSSVTITVISISAIADSTDEHCGQSNGTATVTPSGNCSQNWVYTWNTVPVQHTQQVTHLSAGPYTVTVSCGTCATTATTSVNNLPGPSVAISSITNSTCGLANGSATAAATPITGTYNYHWSNNQQGQTLSNVAAGIYSVTATDANGCNATNTVTITTTPIPIVSIANNTAADCGFPNGGATTNIINGTSPYTYVWNSAPPQITQNLQNVIAGNYSVTATDSNGCTNSVSVAISQNPGPTVTATSINEICGQANGSASALASGGVNNYTYSWSNGEITALDTGLTAGVYTVTISDGGCSATNSIIVNETFGPTAGFNVYPANLTILDGPVYFHDYSAPNVVSWIWDFGDGSGTVDTTSSPLHNYNNIGTYGVTLIVIDNNGCKDTITDTVRVKDIFAFYIPNAFSPNNDMFNDVFTPKGINVDPNSYSEYIFDRWGNIVFHTTKWLGTNAETWNGTLNNNGSIDDVVMDTYVYKIKLKELNGPDHEYIGRITIVE